MILQYYTDGSYKTIIQKKYLCFWITIAYGGTLLSYKGKTKAERIIRPIRN